MAQTVIIAQRDLVVGESVHVDITEAGKIFIAAVCQQIGTKESCVRVIARDLRNRVVGSTYIYGTDTKELILDALQTDVVVTLECLEGSARVRLDQLTGADITGAGNQIQTADIANLAVTNAKLAGLIATAKLLRDAGLLTADVTGRALMATGFFSAAKALDAFAANSMDAAACANAFANGAIPVAKVASAPLSLESVIADPTDGMAIPVTGSGTCSLTVGAGVETRTVADPTVAGRVLQIQTTVFGAGSLAVVFASDITTVAGENSVAFTAAGQTLVVVSVAIGAGFKWRVLANPQALVIS